MAPALSFFSSRACRKSVKAQGFRETLSSIFFLIHLNKMGDIRNERVVMPKKWHQLNPLEQEEYRKYKVKDAEGLTWICQCKDPKKDDLDTSKQCPECKFYPESRHLRSCWENTKSSRGWDKCQKCGDYWIEENKRRYDAEEAGPIKITRG